MIIQFAEKVKPTTHLVLRAYAINFFLPEDYIKRGIGSFSASFSLQRNRDEKITLERARELTIFLCESLLNDINSTLEIQEELDFHPFPAEAIHIGLCFEDPNRVQLGQGVARVSLIEGRIEYEGYNITEYTGKYPAIGKHYTIHEESYAEALDIVKKQSKAV
ncbi:MAG: hypothetical protein KGI83_06710 [Verrucomicrobiota bacterium]|nr:hypothetical protein [Verrucomicrobiota bacterium]